MAKFHFDHFRVSSLTRGEENGGCVNLRCVAIRGKVQPKATFYYKPDGSWICLGCAQKINAQLARFGAPKEAISAQQHLVELLSN